jgi:hypothetical protein
MRQEQPQVVALQLLHLQQRLRQQRLLETRQEQPQVVALQLLHLQLLHPQLLQQVHLRYHLRYHLQLHLQLPQQLHLHYNLEGKH